MRKSGLLMNVSGQRTELLLRQAAERMEACESALIPQFLNKELLFESEENEETEG
jgi:hypothetical protein